jgi:hypothetical protein
MGIRMLYHLQIHCAITIVMFVIIHYFHGSVHRDSILLRSNEKQQYAGIYLLQNHCTYFGCLLHPSSGEHEIVAAASGTVHSI